MSETPFSHPVSFKLASNRLVVIRSVEQALDFLENRWPEVGENMYIAARVACLEALVDARKARAARYAFVDALCEAGLDPAFEFGFMAAKTPRSSHGTAT